MIIEIFIIVLIVVSLVQIFQGSLSVWQMIYGWSDAKKLSHNQFPLVKEPPKTFFSLIVPCRQEKNVIGHTLAKLVKQTYPTNGYEIIVPMASDDLETILEVEETIRRLDLKNVRSVIFSDGPINKSHGLNVALKTAAGDYVGVFDAEDEVDHNLLNAVNTVVLQEGRKIVQTGVRLMNWQSNWFSLHAVLEYFFWFNSRLHWYADRGAITLGGVGIFLPREVLAAVGGWNENSLTEDAQLGIECSVRKFKFRILCEEKHSTSEEVPMSLGSFVKQRTRWTQGFLQVLLDGSWLKLTPVQQVYFLTLVIFPFLQLLLFGWAIFSYLTAPKLPILIVLLSLAPLGLWVAQIAIQIVELAELLHSRNQLIRFPFAVVSLIVTYMPYQFLVSFSAVRAVWRQLTGNFDWEKTQHSNLNRPGDEMSFNPATNL